MVYGCVSGANARFPQYRGIGCKVNKFISFFAIKPLKTCVFSPHNPVDIHTPTAVRRHAVDINTVVNRFFHRVINN